MRWLFEVLLNVIKTIFILATIILIVIAIGVAVAGLTAAVQAIV